MEYIIALSKTLNFTKAASAMCTTQPAFSRRISFAEKKLGVVIFERSKHHVRLTSAGEIVVRELEEVLKHYRSGIKKARYVTGLTTGKLRLGYIPDAVNDDISSLYNSFQACYPHIKVSLHETYYYEMMMLLSSGKLDLVIYTGNCPAFPDDICSLELGQMHLCVFVHDSHKLADCKLVSAEDIMDERFIELNHDIDLSMGWSFVQQFAYENNFKPHVSEKVTMLSSMLFQVSCNRGIALASESVGSMMPEHVRMIHLGGKSLCQRYAVWYKRRTIIGNEVFLKHLVEQIDKGLIY